MEIKRVGLIRGWGKAIKGRGIIREWLGVEIKRLGLISGCVNWFTELLEVNRPYNHSSSFCYGLGGIG